MPNKQTATLARGKGQRKEEDSDLTNVLYRCDRCGELLLGAEQFDHNCLCFSPVGVVQPISAEEDAGIGNVGGR